MAYAPKIVLHCPHGYVARLDVLVGQFLAAGVQFVSVVGEDCERIEDIIDEIVIGNGEGSARFILTSSHPSASVAEVVEFARLLTTGRDSEPQVVVLDK